MIPVFRSEEGSDTTLTDGSHLLITVEEEALKLVFTTNTKVIPLTLGFQNGRCQQCYLPVGGLMLSMKM